MHILLRHLLHSFSILLLAQVSIAQSGSLPSGLDGGKYTPKVSKSNDDDDDDDKSKSKLDTKNTISFSIGHIVRQRIVFFYERTLTQRFSIQAGIGLRYSLGEKSILPNSYAKNLLTPQKNNPEQLSLTQLYDYSNINGKMIPYLELGGKIHTNLIESGISEGSEVRFFGALSMRYFPDKLITSKSSGIFVPNENISISNLGIVAKAGFTHTLFSIVSYEFYVGFGKVVAKYPQYTRNTNPQYQYESTKKTISEIRNTILLGLLIGYTF
jgi:hypothetical protein